MFQMKATVASELTRIIPALRIFINAKVRFKKGVVNIITNLSVL